MERDSRVGAHSCKHVIPFIPSIYVLVSRSFSVRNHSHTREGVGPTLIYLYNFFGFPEKVGVVLESLEHVHASLILPWVCDCQN
jgi:hypothetical protein